MGFLPQCKLILLTRLINVLSEHMLDVDVSNEDHDEDKRIACIELLVVIFAPVSENGNVIDADHDLGFVEVFEIPSLFADMRPVVPIPDHISCLGKKQENDL